MAYKTAEQKKSRLLYTSKTYKQVQVINNNDHGIIKQSNHKLLTYSTNHINRLRQRSTNARQDKYCSRPRNSTWPSITTQPILPSINPGLTIINHINKQGMTHLLPTIYNHTSHNYSSSTILLAPLDQMTYVLTISNILNQTV